MGLLVRETVERCEVCEDDTAHRRRRIRFLPVLTIAALALGIWLVLDGRPGWKVFHPFWVVPVLWVAGRGRRWNIACGRCRARARAESRRTGPTLDGNTEICL